MELVRAKVEVKITDTRYSPKEAEKLLRDSMTLFCSNDIELTLTLDGGMVAFEDWDAKQKQINDDAKEHAHKQRTGKQFT